HGDFGPSFKFRDVRVSELIGQGLPVSLGLGACAVLLAIFLGVPLGALAALRRNGAVDNAIRGVAVLGIARASFLEVMRANHIRTARAKGLSEITIVWRHALRPALMPVVSYLGPATAFVVTGSLVVETVFGLPG